MGFFDTWNDLVSAATPWSEVEAEAPVSGTRGGATTDKTPANPQGEGEGEAVDPSGPTPDKRANKDESDNEESSGEAESADEGNESKDEGGEDDGEEEEEEEEQDPKEKLEEECKESKACAPAKHYFDECCERVTDPDESKHLYKGEDCVEEFFHLAHCANQCAAPKLWSILK